MVKELKTASNNKQSDRTLDLSALGKVKNTNIGAAEKPPLLEPTDAIVKGIEIKMEEDKYEHNKDDDSKIYHSGYVVFETEFENPQTHEIITSKDYFRGLRFYLALDETQAPLRDENGDEVIDRMWIGDQSGLGKILGIVRKHCQVNGNPINSYLDFFQFFTPGTKVQLKSQFNTNPRTGELTVKQQLVAILE